MFEENISYNKVVNNITSLIGGLPAVCEGLIPIPSLVIMALVSGGTLN